MMNYVHFDKVKFVEFMWHIRIKFLTQIPSVSFVHNFRKQTRTLFFENIFIP